MIYEYALDPEILSVWASNDRGYAEFFREYGLGTPRVFSSFPKQKPRKLLRYLHEKNPVDPQLLQGQRYTEMVEALSDVLILRECPNLQGQQWREMTAAENDRCPFGIVLSAAELTTDRNITPENMYSDGSMLRLYHCWIQ